MKEKKIAIVGHGFVGKATESILKKNVATKIIDPKYDNSIQDLKVFNPDLIFICVPTPMGKFGQNGEIIEKVINEISEINLESVIVVKSTLVPSNLKKIHDQIDGFIYNPEFLREKHAYEDFVNSNFIILGGKRTEAEKVKNFYLNYTLCKTKKFIFTDYVRASLVKYTINSFLASKVLFFNGINELFKSEGYSNEDWEEFIQFITEDKRIGASHMYVPGHDGRRGFGGACFPKDIDALIKYGKLKKIDMELLENIQRINNTIRSKYKVETKREIEQDIEFN